MEALISYNSLADIPARVASRAVWVTLDARDAREPRAWVGFGEVGAPVPVVADDTGRAFALLLAQGEPYTETAASRGVVGTVVQARPRMAARAVVRFVYTETGDAVETFYIVGVGRGGWSAWVRR